MQGFMAANHAGYLTGPDAEKQAKEILEKRIADGRRSAINLFEYVEKQQPVDRVARGAALQFDVISQQVAEARHTNVVTLADALEATEEVQRAKGLVVKVGDKARPEAIHDHALGQLAARAEIPSAYLRELARGKEWQMALAAEILSKHYTHGNGTDKYLVRSVLNQVRGVLSSSYRRLDSRPLVEAFAEECQKVGAVPVNGTVTDTRIALKAVVPIVYTPVPGEAMVFGIEWSNSDFGHGKHSLRVFLERLWCLNGATLENALGQVHLGREISDDIEISERTRNLDTQASMSALRDVMQATLSKGAVEKVCQAIQAAQSQGVEWRNVKGALGKRLLKGELDEAEKLFKSEEVVTLPAGQSRWRASNVLSWMAGKSEDPNRKLDLQRLAGEILSGKVGKEEVAEAA